MMDDSKDEYPLGDDGVDDAMPFEVDFAVGVLVRWQLSFMQGVAASWVTREGIGGGKSPSQ